MLAGKPYLKIGDRFTSQNYPPVMREFEQLKASVAHIPEHYKGEIIVSFLKYHCLSNNWIEANPAMCAFIVSKSFRAPEIEAVFEGCRADETFLKGLEDYILTEVRNPSRDTAPRTGK